MSEIRDLQEQRKRILILSLNGTIPEKVGSFEIGVINRQIEELHHLQEGATYGAHEC